MRVAHHNFGGRGSAGEIRPQQLAPQLGSVNDNSVEFKDHWVSSLAVQSYDVVGLSR